MKVAIMQPYIFPYLGYFQLIHAVDAFVFYDDVNFMKKSWINRNRILVNQEESLFSIPLQKASQNKLILETKLSQYSQWRDQFYKTLQQHYAKAPFFSETMELLHNVFDIKYETIADLAIASVIKTSAYIGLTTTFKKSSEQFSETKGLDKAFRLIAITEKCGSDHYINPEGGKELYKKSVFQDQGIKLSFINNSLAAYPQFSDSFIAGLSIIDILMFNTKEEIANLVAQYTLD